MVHTRSPAARRLRRLALTVLGAIAVVLVAAPLAGALDGWLPNPEAGLAAARRSGKPILVGTCWKKGVCNSCDTWRARVRRSTEVATALKRFETVEWLYDGLGGDVIEWTRRHGGTSDDPSAQVFVLSVRGDVIARAPDRVAYTPAKLAAWLEARADAHEQDYPVTALRFERAVVVEEHKDASRDVSLPAFEEARKAGRPVLIFITREGPGGGDEALLARARDARKFAKRVLDSKAAAEAAKGWVLIKLDRSVAFQLKKHAPKK